MPVSFETRQGPRDYQQDRYFMKVLTGIGFDGWLLSVIDGHGKDDSVAFFCQQEIRRSFKLSRVDQTESVLRDFIAKLSSKTNHLEAGSTLSIALAFDNPRKVSVAIIGDSPVVVYDEWGTLHVSPEHNICSREPEIYTIDDPVWVLVASDGLFDPNHIDTQRLLNELKAYAQRRATADDLMEWAEKRGLDDNATALVWHPYDREIVTINRQMPVLNF